MKEKSKGTYEVTSVDLEVAAETVRLNLKARSKLPVMLWGSPGIGKSAIIMATAKAMNLKVIDLRLTSREAQDLSGIPRENENLGYPCYGYIPLDIFLFEDAPEHVVKQKLARPDGGEYDGILYFLDELSSISSEDMKAASYKFLLDRAIDDHKLHSKCHIVCAGNQAIDRAIVNDLGTALSSRLTHVHTKFDFDVQLRYMAKAGWSNVILAFHEFTRNKTEGQNNLYRFDPSRKAEGVAFACPRTWEAVNSIVLSDDFQRLAELTNYTGGDREKLQQSKFAKATLQASFVGLLGYEVAHSFFEFIKNYFNLARVGSIRTEPETAPLPETMSEAYALCSYVSNTILAEIHDDKLVDNLLTYLRRIARKDTGSAKTYPEIAKQSLAYMKLYGVGVAKLEQNQLLKDIESATS